MKKPQDIRIAVDAVVYGYTPSDGLSLLLIQRQDPPFEGHWALPGGPVYNDESLEQAVERVLEEETGIHINYLEQLYTFGSPGRDPRNRAISVSYYAIVRPDTFKLSVQEHRLKTRWFHFQELPKLAFDHSHIIAVALDRLRAKLTYQPIGFELLDPMFPFSDLEKLYATILNRPLDRRNFKKKILRFGFLEKTDRRQKHPGSGRPGYLYKFNEEKYRELIEKGISMEL